MMGVTDINTLSLNLDWVDKCKQSAVTNVEEHET